MEERNHNMAVKPVARLQMRLARGIGWCVVFAVAVAILVENLDGYHNHLGGDYSLSGPTMNWAHGWPCGFMARHSCKLNVASPWPSYSRWPIDDAPAILVSAKYLTVDLLVAVFIIGGTALAVHRWRRRWNDRPVFSLRSWFVLAGIVVAVTVYLQWLIQKDQLLLHDRLRVASNYPIYSGENLTSLPFRYYTHYVAHGLIVLGAALTLLGVCSSITGVLSQIRWVNHYDRGDDI